MGEKQWEQFLREKLDRLRIHFVTEGNQVISIIVIQYEAYIDGKWRAIVRFDEAHGFFHRDIMLPSGKQKKTSWPVFDKNHTLTEVIKEIKENWQAYRQAYEKDHYDE